MREYEHEVVEVDGFQARFHQKLNKQKREREGSIEGNEKGGESGIYGEEDEWKIGIEGHNQNSYRGV